MNKIEFEILSLIQSHPLGISGFDILSHFAQLGPIKINEILLTLHNKGLVKISTISPDITSVYRSTPDGLSALLDYEETLEKEERNRLPLDSIAKSVEKQAELAESSAKKAEKEAKAAKRDRIITTIIAILTLIANAAIGILQLLNSQGLMPK